MKRLINFLAILWIGFQSVNLYSANNISFFVQSPSYLMSGETYNVNVTINRDDVKGYSKFEIEVPNGFELEATQTSGANFIFDNNIAKFIWILLPNIDELTISYKITIPKNYIGKDKIFNRFFYIYNNERQLQEFYSNIKVVNIENDKNNFASVLTINEIVYKVQIGAFSNKLNNNFLNSINIKKYKIEEVLDNYLYKYLVADFKTLEEAQKFIENCNIDGAFIIAFNNYQRITIKEAKTLEK